MPNLASCLGADIKRKRAVGVIPPAAGERNFGGPSGMLVVGRMKSLPGGWVDYRIGVGGERGELGWGIQSNVRRNPRDRRQTGGRGAIATRILRNLLGTVLC